MEHTHELIIFPNGEQQAHLILVHTYIHLQTLYISKLNTCIITDMQLDTKSVIRYNY